MISINGKTYRGNNISVKGDVVYIDGKKVDDKDILEAKTINISVDGNLETLEVENANSIDIKGDAGSVETTNGNVTVGGAIQGDVKTTNGNVRAATIYGKCKTTNGDIYEKS